MSDENIILAPKGLAGVVADDTTISNVNWDSNSLIYRGYRVQDLCETCRFEEVAYLLTRGELPNRAQLDAFCHQERAYRPLSEALLASIRQFPKQAHPMDSLRTCVSFLGMQDDRVWDNSEAVNQDKFMRLLAAIPTMIATCYRISNGKDPIPPNAAFSISENFFHMCFGKIPAPEVVKAFDVSLILYAEHSFNASTFTSRVIASTTSDLYSAVTGGIGALKGPLHGGANEYVMHMMKEIDDPSLAREWMLDALAKKKKVMGFGHRVYRNGDSRVPTMTKYMRQMAEFTGGAKWVAMFDVLKDTMIAEKNIHPNLDFPAGPAYYMMGFDIEMFTPIFVMARITGWSAHIMEQTAANRIIRPLANYTGREEREIPALDMRA